MSKIMIRKIRSPSPISVSWPMLLCLAVGIPLLLTGCVRRRLMVRSNPPGAIVYVDNQPIGTTPCATDFVYYGTREIRLVKPGFETLTVSQPIPAPWYEIPPLDFVSENLMPQKIQDYRTVSFNMVPQVIVPTEQLLSRAEQLRQSTMQGAVLPASATSLPSVTTPLVPTGPSSPFGVPGNGVPENVAPGQVLPRGGQALEPLPVPNP